MALLVQKFGGSSLGSVAMIDRAAERVIDDRHKGNDVVVVLSAMGDATDRLMDLARSVTDKPNSRELDALLATGEQVSTALFSLALQNHGQPARSYTGGQVRIVTNDIHGKARIREVDTENLRADLSGGTVPVVAGFQGVDDSGSVTTIGRGGSDTTAVAIAAALDADECHILTDVDGVYTTDPRVVPAARRLNQITYDEMLELSSQGSRVLQMRAVEFASKYGVLLRVLSSNADSDGTLIGPGSEDMEAPVVAGIAFNQDEAEIVVTAIPDRPGIAHQILKPIADAHIEVDMMVLNAPRGGRVDLCFTVHREHYSEAMDLVRAAVKSIDGADVTGNDRVVKISLVGVGIRSHTDVTTRMLEALATAGINLRMIATSEIKVSVLVPEDSLETGVRCLHEAFGLDREAGLQTAGEASGSTATEQG